MSLLTQKHLQDEAEAYAWVEAHIWPNGPVCPHCARNDRISKMHGKATRIGLYKCYACRKQFNVKVGTIFESSHVPMHLWLQAFYLIAGSKKGISSNQIHRTLGVTLKTAWFMMHRVRYAMTAGSLAAPPLGGEGSSGIVEADETFIGNKKGVPKKRAYHHKHAVMSLVERGGDVRSFHIEKANAANCMAVIRANVSPEARVMTDEAKYYSEIGGEFAEHGTVNHSAGQYVDGDAHTNTLEGFYSIFKRGMRGVYQHCSEKHLHRYVDEFGFRYNNRVKRGVNDEQRAIRALKGVVGKRLTYRTIDREVTDAQEEAPF
jgi:transposase-like protein